MSDNPDIKKIINSLDVKNLLDHQEIFEELGIGPARMPKTKHISHEEEAKMSLDEKCRELQKVHHLHQPFSKFSQNVRVVSFKDNAKVYTQILDSAEKTAHGWGAGFKLKQNFVEYFPAGDLVSMLHYAGEHLQFEGCFFNEEFLTNPFNTPFEKCVYINLDAKSLSGKYLHIPQNQVSEYIRGDDKNPPPPEGSQLAAFSQNLNQPQEQSLWVSSYSTTTTVQVPTAQSFESARLTPVDKNTIKEFKNRLTQERALLYKKIKQEDPQSLKPDPHHDGLLYSSEQVVLLKTMDQILKNVDYIKIYEAFTTPINGIPAIYRRDTNTIYFSDGNLNFNLWFHEMGHATQIPDKDGFREFHTPSGNNGFAPNNIRNDVDYIHREEEVYQWNVSYTLFKAGYGQKEVDDLQNALLELNLVSPANFESLRMRAGFEDVHPNVPSNDICRLASGKHPKAYEKVLNLFKRIENIPDFSKSEKDSALQLVAAYFDIVLSPNGKISIEPGQMQKLLGNFYQGHLHQ